MTAFPGACTIAALSSPTRRSPPEDPEPVGVRNDARGRTSPAPGRAAPLRAGLGPSSGCHLFVSDDNPFEVGVNTDLPRHDEDRLAALWEQPLDATTVGDDRASTLFSAPDDAATRRGAHHRTGRADRSAARRRRGHDRRRRWRARPPGPHAAIRWLALGVALLVAIVSTTIALSSSTGSTDSSEMVSPAETRPTTVLPPPARPTPSEPELSRAEAVRPRAQRGSGRRARAAPVRHERPRAAQRARRVPTRTPVPSRPVQQSSEPAAAPPTAVRRSSPPPTVPASSACDEFPPC